MSIASVITRGLGTFGSIADVIRRGFSSSSVGAAAGRRTVVFDKRSKVTVVGGAGRTVVFDNRSKTKVF